jgi:hypothetical protein
MEEQQPNLGHKIESREEAQLLRMERMLDNAQCTLLCLDVFVDNPEVSLPDLQTKLQDAGVWNNEEAVSSFLLSMKKTHSQVKKAISFLDEKMRIHHISKGEILFGRIISAESYTQNKSASPQGVVRLVEGNPFAVVLECAESSDFARIDKRTDVGGFFTDSQPIETLIEDIQFPLIVIRGLTEFMDGDGKLKRNEDKIGYLKHELDHAKNKVFINALRLIGKDRAVVWGGFIDVAGKVDSARRLKALWNSHPDEARGSVEWQSILGYALQRAKNELLADVGRSESFSTHLNNLIIQNGMYDFFLKKLGIPAGSGLHAALWVEYDRILKVNVLNSSNKGTDYNADLDTAEEVLQSYKALGLGERGELFRWVLGQIPLDKWKDQLDKTLFVDEAKCITAILASKENNPAVGPIIEEFKEYARNNQFKPLVIVAREYLERIQSVGH